MDILTPATIDLIDRLTRHRDRLIASGRTSSAAFVDAAIVEVRAEAIAGGVGPTRSKAASS